jgi:hypothetical protein
MHCVTRIYNVCCSFIIDRSFKIILDCSNKSTIIKINSFVVLYNLCQWLLLFHILLKDIRFSIFQNKSFRNNIFYMIKIFLFFFKEKSVKMELKNYNVPFLCSAKFDQFK